MAGDGEFVRPASVPMGVWGRLGTFRIEDIPDNRRKEVIQHMNENFFLDEPLTSVLRKTKPYSQEDIDLFQNIAMDTHMSLCAVDESNNDEIVGVTIIRVMSRCAPNKLEEMEKKFPSLQDILHFIHYCHNGLDPFTYESNSTKVVVDHVLDPMGLSVSAKHRGKGIGEALIKARHKLAAAAGVGATHGLYTSIYSQKIILRQPGMKVVNETPYSDYIVDGKAIFAEVNPPHPSALLISGLITKDMV